MGGADKTALPFGGTTVLDHLLDSLPATWPTVCVGEPRPTRRDVGWTRESPPGGGPVAGMAAGLARVATPVVVLLAGDLPFAGPAAAHLASVLVGPPAPSTPAVAEISRHMWRELSATSEGEEAAGVLAVDGEGRAQPLLAAYRTDTLRAALPAQSRGARLRDVIARVTVRRVPTDDLACLDVDTPEALAEALGRLET